MGIKPTLAAAELAELRAKSGLPLTPDQYAKLMKSTRLADEALERKRQEKEAKKKAEKEAMRNGR
jgi:hypothetical protein